MPKKDVNSSGDGRVIPRLPKEDGESKADYLKRVKNSGRGYKARFSITAKSAKRLAQAVEKVPTPAGISQINAMIREIGSTLAPIKDRACLLYTSPSPRDKRQSRMPSSA